MNDQRKRVHDAVVDAYGDAMNDGGVAPTLGEIVDEVLVALSVGGPVAVIDGKVIPMEVHTEEIWLSAADGDWGVWLLADADGGPVDTVTEWKQRGPYAIVPVEGVGVVT